jgi:hypothetical protein
VAWVAVFQRNILLASSAGCLKMEAVYFFRTVPIPDYLVPVWRDTISMLFGLKRGHEIGGELG